MKNKKVARSVRRLALAFLLVALVVAQAFGCTSVFVGKEASATGNVLIARNEDYRAGWAKHFIINEAVDVASGDVQEFWSGMTLGYPEGMTRTLKYFSVPDWVYDVDEEWVPMDEVGINEAGVAVSATETQRQNEAAAAINPEDGFIEEAQIPSIILPRARTAREGVEIFGAAMDAFGAMESGGFAIADKDEVWYIEYSGHLWAAARIPDDSYIIVPNENVLSNYNPFDEENFMGSDNILALAREHELLSASQMTDEFVRVYGFNFAKAYGQIGDFSGNGVRVWWGHRHFTPSLVQRPELEQYPFLMQPDEKITKKAIMDFLQSANYDDTVYENSNPGVRDIARPIAVRSTLESHVVEMGEDDETPGAIGNVLWLAMGNSHGSVYLPFCAGITEIPEPYSRGTDERDDDSAFWTFYGPVADAQAYDDEHGTRLWQALQDYWSPYQEALIASHADFVASARAKWRGLQSSADSSELAAYLNGQGRVFFEAAAETAADLGEALAEAIAEGEGASIDFAPAYREGDAPLAEDVEGYVPTGGSSGGCAAGAFAPATLLLLLPLAFAFRRR
ncbi:MAG: C69 family dipeptidase [Synergistaceae bacterium]|nr:C69 family dipeptidase [Synergistaceae bacterium]